MEDTALETSPAEEPDGGADEDHRDAGEARPPERSGVEHQTDAKYAEVLRTAQVELEKAFRSCKRRRAHPAQRRPSGADLAERGRQLAKSVRTLAILGPISVGPARHSAARGRSGLGSGREAAPPAPIG